MEIGILIALLGVALGCFLILLNIDIRVKDVFDRQSETDNDSCIDFEKTINNWAERCDKNHQYIDVAIRDLYDNIRSLQQQMREMKQKMNDIYVEED